MFSNIGLYCAVFGALSIWFGWALWASCRVYSNQGGAGWCILFVVLGFVLGGVSSVFFAIEKSGEEAYAVLREHRDEDLNRDWNVGPYSWTLKSLVNYNTWQAPGLTQTLFYLGILVIFIYYLDYTVSSPTIQAPVLYLSRLDFHVFSSQRLP